MELTKGVEELSVALAERFATKCFTPLELAHFKDNFFSRATDQGGMKYWNEKTLSDFLGIPDSSDADCPLDAGPVIFRMVSYLGAFPFQNTLAPSVLTFEAMVKVVVLLTERYGKVLRRASKDRIRLLFGSLADVGRKDVDRHPTPNKTVEEYGSGDSPVVKSHAMGFSIDEPANDSYEDDEDDDLALAALESLDAIEVFRHDSRIDKAVYEARISIATFRRLLMLLLVISPLESTQSVEIYTTDLSKDRMESVRKEADNLLAAFPQEKSGGISYVTFAKTISTSLPFIFDPLTPLFEHLLFSKNLDLSQKRSPDDPRAAASSSKEASETLLLPLPESVMLPGSFKSVILNPSIISHLSFFLPSTTSNQNLLRGNTRLHPVFSTAGHGTSLTSFSHNVLTWQSGTLLLLEGYISGSSRDQETPITIGAFLPQPWKSGTLTTHSTKPTEPSTLPCLFQLSRKHLVLQGNSSPSVQKPNMPTAYFSTHSGISIGCQIPPSSRTQQLRPSPLGAGSLTIDVGLETANFHVSPIGQNGVFLPPATGGPSDTSTTRTHIDIYNLEIWGLVPDPSTSTASEPGQSAAELQQARWEFEAREAERRRNLNLKAGAGDSAAESARWLLETAGLIGDSTGRPRQSA
ncbi:TLD domain-containing protein [Aspergillus tanneri]|uniref:Restriction of telomere capping protein 5 n=1 Tax=Aspergillus tanneri TaxID=1220188 RepID=A0A5M9MPL5_9EURO|nr:Restriction of telomere capping protein 5 [Aspergillus tanneri]KAA8649031.1 Restriction of telomere capping protein 5 [Aspergillus tanneri]